MTDRELLELAAKAAGYRFVRWDEGRLVADIESRYPGFTEEWNPLTDDADALRLAVDLWMNVEIDGGTHGITSVTKLGGNLIFVEHEACADKYAATRRAIVMAAAEIGRKVDE